jgi:hypothetical protein
MADKKSQPAPLAVPSAGSELMHLVRQGGVKLVDVTAVLAVHDMTPIASETMKTVSENTYAVPAREQTKRARWSTAKHFGTLGVIAFAIYELASKLTDPRLAAGLLALALLIFAFLKAKKALGDD